MRAKVFRYVKITGALLCVSLLTLLAVSLDSLMRASSNPFFAYMTDRIGEGIPALASGVRPIQ